MELSSRACESYYAAVELKLMSVLRLGMGLAIRLFLESLSLFRYGRWRGQKCEYHFSTPKLKHIKWVSE
jgi:hypothetical protein